MCCVQICTQIRNIPNANRLFSSPPRPDGSEKWEDFADRFWHFDCVGKLSLNAFTERYRKWCKKHGYNFSVDKAARIHEAVRNHIAVMSMNETTRFLTQQAVPQLQTTQKALVAFADIDAPPYQSGQDELKSSSISKRGSSSLRRTLFPVMSVILQTLPEDQPVYQFMDKKRSESKPYKVYMMALANKFLCMCYASVTKYLDSLESV